MNKSIVALLLLALAAGLSAQPVSSTIETIAGRAGVGDGGAVQNALLFDPRGIAITVNTVTQITTLYVADRGHHRVRRFGQNVSSVAGNGIPGSSGDGGQGAEARLNGPSDVALDSAGNIYIADTNNRKIRLVNPQGVITTFAGNGNLGFSGDGGQAVNASLGLVEGIVRDGLGSLFIADTTNHRIRKVDPEGIITTVAGTGVAGFSGDGGPGTNAQLSSPTGVVFGRPGTMYQGALLIADFGNNRIRMLKDGNISTIAGNGIVGFAGDGGQATSAQVGQPRKLAVDQANNLYVSQEAGSRVRRITGAGVISTFAGAGFGFGGDGGQAVNAMMRSPEGIATPATGTLYIADSGNHRVRRVGPTPGVINTYTGRAHFSGNSLPATSTDLFMPYGLETDSQTSLLIADSLNHSIRKLTFSGGSALDPADTEKGAAAITISTLAGTGESGFSGDGGAGTGARLAEPRDVAVSSLGDIFIADRLNHRIRRLANGTISTFAGNGTQGFGGDGGAATGASLNSPSAVAVDANRNVYVADAGNHRIRRITSGGTISTFAGTGVAGFSGDGGQATSAQLNTPTGVEVDGTGNVFISDTFNRRVRVVRPGGVISTVAGNGGSTGAGDNIPATQAEIDPWDIAVGPLGDLYIADGAARIRRVASPFGAGTITTVAGTGVPGYFGDGDDPLKARMHQPRGLTVDVLNTLYIADSANNVIRRITSSGPGLPLITTAGVVDAAGFGPRLAPDSIATAFVRNGGGGSIEITDSQGSTRDSTIFFNNGTQINFLIDAATALGAATIRLRRSGTMSSAPIMISNTGAGIFFASGVAGQAVGLAQYLRISNGVAGPLLLTYEVSPTFAPVPIDLGPPSDQVFLVLYCTGMRSAGNVQATIGGMNAPIFARVPAPGFEGLDQVNIGPIPRSFINAGTVKVQLNVDGIVTNSVDVRFN